MARLLRVIIVEILFFIILLGNFATYAESDNKTAGTWAFYIYMVDNETSAEANSRIIKEMGSVSFPSNVKVISESSFNSTLPAFLTFCGKKYSADHKVLIISGDGEGMYGIRGANFKYTPIKEIANALKVTYAPSDTKPAFDLTIMDASLMSSAEMGKILKGYSKYLIAPESFMYKKEGFYRNWFTDFCKDTTMSTVDLGKLIIDKYKLMIDEEHISKEHIISSNLVLCDVNALAKSYTDYSIIAKCMLKRIAKDNLMLSLISKAARRTVMAGDTLDDTMCFNMCDYMDLLRNFKKLYPIECSKAMKDLEASVIYKAITGFREDSFGVGIYFPVKNFDGSDRLLNSYVVDISGNKYIRSLYLYKMTGEVSKELSEIGTKEKVGTFKKINCKELDSFANLKPKTTVGTLNLDFQLSKNMKALCQYANVFMYKRDDNSITSFGEDSYCVFDRKNNLNVISDAKWDAINDAPLFICPMSDAYMCKRYYTKALWNESASNLYCVYDKESGKPKMVGILDDEMVGTKLAGSIVTPLKNGDNISLYKYVTENLTGFENEEVATTFSYNDNYRVENQILADGAYTCFVMLEDIQGNNHKSQDIFFNIKDGHIKDVMSYEELFKKK